jgi:hypothetical protein
MLIRSLGGAGARLMFAAVVLTTLSASAQAAAYLTFVSATGLDSRPCTVQAQPCKTLQRAVTVTSADGTISILSDLSGNAGIAKSLTIDGGGNSVIGTIAINSASAVVTLRGLNLTGRGAVANGIRILSAAAVHIEDSTVERYTIDGIKLVATTATKLFITDTVSRANGSDGLYVDDVNAQVVIENSAFDQNFSSGVYLKAAEGKAKITGSSASGNGQNGFVLASGGAKVVETAADNNSQNGFIVRIGRNYSSILDFARATGNGAAGLLTESPDGVARIGNCVFHPGSSGGLGVDNQGSLLTYGNNLITGRTGSELIAVPLQ